MNGEFCLMTDKNMEVIEVDDYSPSPQAKFTPLRPVFCLKNKDEIKKFERKEECFILMFDPDDDISKFSSPKDCDDAEADLCVVAEKGQVACRDYPHSRDMCAKFPFQKTPHESHCELCYCYVCDLAAPCENWCGASGHCHAFNDLVWNTERYLRKLTLRCEKNNNNNNQVSIEPSTQEPFC